MSSKDARKAALLSPMLDQLKHLISNSPLKNDQIESKVTLNSNLHTPTNQYEEAKIKVNEYIQVPTKDQVVANAIQYKAAMARNTANSINLINDAARQYTQLNILHDHMNSQLSIVDGSLLKLIAEFNLVPYLHDLQRD